MEHGVTFYRNLSKKPIKGQTPSTPRSYFGLVFVVVIILELVRREGEEGRVRALSLFCMFVLRQMV